MLCALNVGTVPTFCILDIGTVPTFSRSLDIKANIDSNAWYLQKQIRQIFNINIFISIQVSDCFYFDKTEQFFSKWCAIATLGEF